MEIKSSLCIFGLFLLLDIRIITCNLDVLVSGEEMQKLLFGSESDIKIVENGNLSNILKRNLSAFLPPIQPKFSELKLQFASANRLYYQMNLTSSDLTIMANPTVTIPYKGRLQKKFIAFEIRFPCRKLKTGMVKLGIVVDFFFNKERTLYKRIDLSMRRYCKAEKRIPSHGLPSAGCRKKCNLKNFRRKYCLSDFVARVKITKAALNEAEPFYLANFPRRRIYKRARTLKMIKKNQVIKARGNRLTCDCKVLEEGKRYLLFGREDRYNNVLYVDNFSIAFEIPKNDKRADSVVRDFQRERQTIHCPFSNLL